MSQTKEQLLEKLEMRIPINELQQNLQIQLLERSAVLEFKKGTFIFKQGDKDNYAYYLLDGELELYSNEQLQNAIKSDSDRAKYALAQLQPRQLSAKTKTSSIVLQVDRGVLDQLLLLAQEATISPIASKGVSKMQVEEVDDDSDSGDWMTQMLQSELFSRIPMANMHQLFTLLESIDTTAGEVVIKQGEPGEHYYIIAEGRCIVSRKPSPSSDDIKLATLVCGDGFGEEALISDSTRNSTVTMINDGMLMRLAKEQFVELIKNPTLSTLKFAAAKELVDKEEAQWLDVRFPNEYKESSIEGSINIPLSAIRLQVDKLDKDKQYIIYCETGARSSTATFLLIDHGFNVTYLEGGLVNNPDALNTQQAPAEPAPTPEAKPESAPEPTLTPTPEAKPEPVAEPTPTPEAKSAPEPEPQPKTTSKTKKRVAQAPEPRPESLGEVDAEVRFEMINAEIETTLITMEVTEKESQDDTDVEKKQELEEIMQQLADEKARLEQEKTKVQAEVQKRTEEQEFKLNKIQKEAEAKIQQEKTQLEGIYNKHAKEMEKLQQEKKQAAETLNQERKKLEQQEQIAKQKAAEAERLKKEVETAKNMLDMQSKKKHQEEQTSAKDIQATIKAEVEKKRKELALQYEQSNQELESLKKEKMKIEAARKAAKDEAQNIIREYKKQQDEAYAIREAKINADSRKLEEKEQAMQETMEEIQQTNQTKKARFAEDDDPSTRTQIQMPMEHINRITQKAKAAKTKVATDSGADGGLLSGLSKRLTGKK